LETIFPRWPHIPYTRLLVDLSRLGRLVLGHDPSALPQLGIFRAAATTPPLVLVRELATEQAWSHIFEP
jgi:hypothetical protein